MANIPVTEITKFLNLNDSELEVEQGATATITAQLKNRERTFLQERSELRARITVPPSADDDAVQQELLRVTGDIRDNEEEINRNNAIASLIAKLRSVRPAGGTPPPGRAGSLCRYKCFLKKTTCQSLTYQMYHYMNVVIGGFIFISLVLVIKS